MINTYYLFITALISSYEDMVIAALVKDGFQVSSLSEDNKVTIGDKNSVSVIIALRVDTEIDGAINVHDKVENVLEELKIMYYSLVVAESTDCAWNASHLKLIKALPPPLPPTIKKLDPSMN